MSDITKEMLFGELKRTHEELQLQRKIGNAREPWEIDFLGILQQHGGNFWTAASDLIKQTRQAETHGFYRGMIHGLHEIITASGVPLEEVLSFERGLLGLVEESPGSGIFVPLDEVGIYRDSRSGSSVIVK